MMEQLKGLIEQLTAQEVTKSDAIDNNLASNVAKETGTTLVSGSQNALSSGNVSDIMGMLTSGGTAASLASNPVVKNIIESLTNNLGNNVGIDKSAASGFAGGAIPKILEMVLGSAKSGSNGFNITDLVSSLGGSGSILNNLKDFGLDQNGDGKVDIQDAISAITGSGKKGGLGGLLGGLFGKK
ncbi:MAG: hypothetical protein KBS98_03835 [Flavobacterium sp.]|nr:hypothetical protein [Candidatus Neoflavobacterium equi]